MDGERTRRWMLGSPGLTIACMVFPVILFIVIWLGGSGPAIGGTEVTATSRILPTGDAIELNYRSDENTWTDLIPVHREGPVRYFSAGIGMAERAVEYPPFPLKIVLTAGGKPYLARVGVEIASLDGAIRIMIPVEHVTGPWLFLDLPPGTYDLTGVRGEEKQQLRRVAVQPGSSHTLYFRFSGE